MYATTCSSAELRAKRKENGFLRTVANLSIGSDCIVGAVQVSSDRGRFAERLLHGVDDAGREERISIWIER
jgi:hypothetical protein